VTLYSKNGGDISRRFAALHSILAAIPVRSAAIDCELVACDATGRPCFRALIQLSGKAPALCLWCFDLLHLNGVKLTSLPLHERKAQLARVVAAADDEHLQFSGDFPSPEKLVAACHKMGVEGIVSKRLEPSYRSGPTHDWLKIKTATWRAANKDRWELFEKKRA
jgi:bifunctional non-homologous end joining protein LigD